MTTLLSDPEIAERIFNHIDNRTTDLADGVWREPVDNYRSQARFEAELRLLRRTPTPFCPSAALPEPGAYIAREAALTPILAVRGMDGIVRAFRNACRHRGAQVACGEGHEKAFVCRYHGWTYGLDGALRGVPAEHGFPGLDKSQRGLVPLRTEERGGLVFITQEPSGDGAAPPDLPAMLAPGLKYVSVNARETLANWKVAAEGFLEGYHIYSTHRDSFFPVQYDNLNVVEAFGRNSRVTFPYRNIERLRAAAPGERRAEGKLTFLYHLFPNVMLATLPKRLLMVVLEPVSLGVTNDIRYMLADEEALASDRATLERGLVFDAQGAREDREIVESIQRGLAGKGNSHFEFGRFEGAIGHFHRNLHDALDPVAGA